MAGQAVRYVIGADENGLGPRLGPMTVTAVLARVTDDGAQVVTRKPRGALKKRLGDSKALVAHGDIALAEAWSRALVARGAGKHLRDESPDAVLDALTLDERSHLTAPCPTHVASQCWSTEGEEFSPRDAMGDTLKLVFKDLDRLAKRGVEIVAVRSVVVCTQRLNEAVDRGESRFVVDLHSMERLILAFREIAGQDVDAVCGKVGGFGAYSKAFGPLGGRLHAVMEEGRARSSYRFPGIGDIAFVRDSDDSNLLVGMASLVGKYFRELLMERIVHHYRAADPEVPVASGYHDPVTGQFVVATESLRRQRRIPDRCFERGSIGPPSSARRKKSSAKAKRTARAKPKAKAKRAPG
jgi:ribonuclease HII